MGPAKSCSGCFATRSAACFASLFMAFMETPFMVRPGHGRVPSWGDADLVLRVPGGGEPVGGFLRPGRTKVGELGLRRLPKGVRFKFGAPASGLPYANLPHDIANQTFTNEGWAPTYLLMLAFSRHQISTDEDPLSNHRETIGGNPARKTSRF